MNPVKFFDLNMGELPIELPLLILPDMVLMPEGKFSMRITDIKQISKVFWALANGRMLAVVQKKNLNDLYNMGCAARICGFSENEDDSLTLSLMGVCRFVSKDRFTKENYDMVKVDYKPFAGDFSPVQIENKTKLLNALDFYLKTKHIDADVLLFENMSARHLVATLVSILPLRGTEKQALLEKVSFGDIIRTFIMILQMAETDDLSGKERQKC